VVIDTHCHLNFNSYTDDLPEVVKRSIDAGVERMVVPAIDLSTSRDVIALSEKYPEIFCTIGVHPNDCQGFSASDIYQLKLLTKHQKVIGIGEIGLDNFHQKVPMDTQVGVFNDLLAMACDVNLPVVIHNRDADHEIFECIEKWVGYLETTGSPLKENPGILHAFSSDLVFAEKSFLLNFFVGAAGPITFKNTIDRQEVFRQIPPGKVVIETDSPFLTPEPFRGKRNEPTYCTYIQKRLAEIWQISSDEVGLITTNNASRIFGWKELIKPQ
jgi:TatD DNase family protein